MKLPLPIPTLRPARRSMPLAALAAGLLVLAGCSGTSSGGGENQAADFPTEAIEIMAPADPGGGYDMTARSIGKSLSEGSVIDSGTEVYNAPGGSGTAGLTPPRTANAGSPHAPTGVGKILRGPIAP